jgi:hypothetical protein
MQFMNVEFGCVFGGCPVLQNVKRSIGLLSTSLNAKVPKQAGLEAWILIVGHSLRCIALESQGVRIIRSSLTSDTSNVNEVGPPAQVLLNPDGATLMQQRLPSWTVTSNEQQSAKAKKVC